MMKSKISIEMDFEKGATPIIQILQRFSDDLRDKTLSQFTDVLATQSSWGVISNVTQFEDHEGVCRKWHIIPIPSGSKMYEQYALMGAMLKSTDPKWGLNVHNNSKAFQQFLTEEGYEWSPNEHSTLIHGKDKGFGMQVDLFEIGMKYQQYINKSKIN